MTAERDELTMRIELVEREIAPHLEKDEQRLLSTDKLRTISDELRAITATAADERRRGAFTTESAERAGTLDRTLNEIDAQGATLDEELVAMRARAIRGLVPSEGGGWVERRRVDPTLEQREERREIRDLIRSQLEKDPDAERLRLQRTYLEEVAKGSDADEQFLAAVEGAPKSFALIDDRTRQRADEIRIGLSPLKSRIDRLVFAREMHRLIISTARSRLRELGWQEAQSQPVDREEQMRQRLQEDARRRGRA
jgi:hypothetical protein